MSENLISKKELLSLTGITYGQLYRWKRKQLIPEEWFIKRASYTGQETYFPKDKILERIEKILNLKDGKSLDELAETFSPALSEFDLSMAAARENPIFRPEVIDLYSEHFSDPLSFGDLLGLLICQDQLLSGHLTQAEGVQLIGFLKAHVTALPEKSIALKYLRKLGMGIFILYEPAAVFITEEDTKIILDLSLQTYIETLKTSLVA